AGWGLVEEIRGVEELRLRIEDRAARHCVQQRDPLAGEGHQAAHHGRGATRSTGHVPAHLAPLDPADAHAPSCEDRAAGSGELGRGFSKERAGPPTEPPASIDEEELATGGAYAGD